MQLSKYCRHGKTKRIPVRPNDNCFHVGVDLTAPLKGQQLLFDPLGANNSFIPIFKCGIQSGLVELSWLTRCEVLQAQSSPLIRYPVVPLDRRDPLRSTSRGQSSPFFALVIYDGWYSMKGGSSHTYCGSRLHSSNTPSRSPAFLKVLW